MRILKPTSENFENNTLRLDYNSRGGGVEISLTFFGIENEKMSAYQNYLGGGMLGKICSSNTINAKHKIVEYELQQQLNKIELELLKYFHSLTNNSSDEFENQSFEQNQNMPVSAY